MPSKAAENLFLGRAELFLNISLMEGEYPQQLSVCDNRYADHGGQLQMIERLLAILPIVVARSGVRLPSCYNSSDDACGGGHHCPLRYFRFTMTCSDFQFMPCRLE